MSKIIHLALALLYLLPGMARADLVTWDSPATDTTVATGTLNSNALSTGVDASVVTIGGSTPLIRQDTGGNNFIFVEEDVPNRAGTFTITFDDAVSDLVLNFSSIAIDGAGSQIGNFSLIGGSGSIIFDSGTNLDETFPGSGIWQSGSGGVQGSGTFTSTATAPISGFQFDLVDGTAGGGGGIILTVDASLTAAPEPSSFAYLILTIVFAVVCRNRRTAVA